MPNRAVSPDRSAGSLSQSGPPPGPTRAYFEDAALKDLRDRATRYARAGVCLHLCGAAGMGKTSLALRVAAALGRPVALMTGNPWLATADFLGREVGTTTSSVVDNYIQSVQRSERQTWRTWRASLLAEAMTQGRTVVYDEFTRATPEANAVLLSVIEEGVLVSTDPLNPQPEVVAHPDFRLILTSNPHDYVGVNAAPDALLDRVVTLEMTEPPAERVAGIVARRTGLTPAQGHRIAALVRTICGTAPPNGFSTLRGALLIARIVASSGATGDDRLAEIAADVLAGRGLATSTDKVARALTTLKAA